MNSQKRNLKGLLIHVGEYVDPSSIDEKKPADYTLKYAQFDEDGVVAKGRPHIDPEFKTFTYGDDPANRAKANLKKLGIGDYMFFMWTFIKRNSSEKLRYIPGYFKIKETRTVWEILNKSLGASEPYCNNDHVKLALSGIQEQKRFTIFVGDAAKSRLCRNPLRLDKAMIQKLHMRNSSGELIAPKIGHKKDKNGRLMTEIETINVFTRNPKIIDENQVLLILDEMKTIC